MEEKINQILSGFEIELEKRVENMILEKFGEIPEDPQVLGPKMLAEEENFQLWQDETGRTYFYNIQTKQSQWNKPAHLFKDYNSDPSLILQQTAEAEGYDQWEDEQYSTSYSDLTLQQSMINDQPRSDAYKNAIQMFKKVDFEDKVVLDVGAGTGLLSYFALQAGARKVYSVEMSDLAELIPKVAQKNGWQDKLTVFHDKVENVQLPEQVDIIISEWMGSFAVFESMIESVLIARDRWLKSTGMIYPSRFSIYVAPIHIDDLWQEKVGAWKNVYGIDMSDCMDQAKSFFSKPLHTFQIKPDQVLAKPECLRSFDILSMKVEDLNEMTKSCSFSFLSSNNFHGFAAWFDVTFESSWHRDPSRLLDIPPLVLSTSPDSPATHWKQDLWIFESDPFPLQIQKGQTLSANISILRHSYWKRHYNIFIHASFLSTNFSKVFNRWRIPSKH